MIKWISVLCMIGSFMAFGLGTLGLYRFPDSYTRIHGVGMGDTLGVGLAGLALILRSPSGFLQLKLVFILILFWIISPTMSHLVAKAGLLHGVKPTEETKMRRG